MKTIGTFTCVKSNAIKIFIPLFIPVLSQSKMQNCIGEPAQSDNAISDNSLVMNIIALGQCALSFIF